MNLKWIMRRNGKVSIKRWLRFHVIRGKAKDVQAPRHPVQQHLHRQELQQGIQAGETIQTIRIHSLSAIISPLYRQNAIPELTV